MMLRNATIRLVYVYEMPKAARDQACADITRWLETGRATHAITGRYPLAQLAAAHEAVEGGGRIGHVVVDIDAGR